MKIGVIGKTGQLGKALAARAPEATFWGREKLDLSSELPALRAAVKTFPDIDVVVIAAAYTHVDAAEENKVLAYTVNGISIGAIATQFMLRNIPIIYVSTDYVFDGRSRRPYRPKDKLNPLNIYGESKKMGETNVMSFSPHSAVLRTSWLFDGTSKNFLTTMLSLKDKGELRVVSDQIGRPTYAGHLADAVLKLAKGLHAKPEKAAGIYHASANGEPVSWHGFAEQIFSSIGGGPKLAPVSTEDYGAPAPRPKYSVLNNSAFEKRFDHVMPDWMDGLRAALNEAGYET